MYFFATAEQTSTVKMGTFFFFYLRFKTKEWVLKVNKSESNGDNDFNGNFLGVEDNCEYSKYKKTWFYVFLLLVL